MEKVKEGEDRKDVPVARVVLGDLAQELANEFLRAQNADTILQIISAYRPEQWLPAFVIFGSFDPLVDKTGDFYVKLNALIQRIREGKLLEKLSADEKPRYVEVIKNFAIAVKAGAESAYRTQLEQARLKEQERIQREQERKQAAAQRELAETLTRSLTANRRSAEISSNPAQALAEEILKEADADLGWVLGIREISLWVPAFKFYSKMYPEDDSSGLYFIKLDNMIKAIEAKNGAIDQVQYREFEEVKALLPQGRVRTQRESEYKQNLEKVKKQKEQDRKGEEDKLAKKAKRLQEEKQKDEEEKARQKREVEEKSRKDKEEKLEESKRLREEKRKAEEEKVRQRVADGEKTKGGDGALAEKLKKRRERAEASPVDIKPIANGEGARDGRLPEEKNEHLLQSPIDQISTASTAPEIGVFEHRDLEEQSRQDLESARADLADIQRRLDRAQQAFEQSEQSRGVTEIARAQLEDTCRLLMLQLEQVGTKHQAIVDEAETVRAELAHQRDNLRNELVELRESHRTLEEKKQIIELSLAQEQDGRRKAELVGEEHKVARQRLTDELTQIRQDLRDEGNRVRELMRTLEHYTDRTVALEKENNALREHFESLQNELISAQKVSEEAKRALEEEERM